MGKQIFLEDIQAEQLCLLDPLARLLLRVTRQNGLYMALIAVVIHSILIIGGGWLISVSYTGQEFRPVYDTRELIYLIFQFIFVVPLLWAFYVLEPIRILQIFQGLAQNEVVGASKSSYANIDEFIHKEVHLINRKANLIVVIIITIS
ncbi:MAG TPA: hypothetical protein VEP90_11660, partial [Methylomirabilota bacterium]|nr:hypothetical protein [Methylomirabilota bacterium]